MRVEYDFSQMKPATIGKYFNRAIAGMKLVKLDDDVAEIFPDTDAVNRALRLLIEIGVGSRARKRPARHTTKRHAAALGRKAKGSRATRSRKPVSR